MLNEGRLPPHLRVERIGRLWYVMLPEEEPALLTVGYARVSSHEQKPQLEPQANRLWAYAGQNQITLDRVVSEVASGSERPATQAASAAVGSQGGDHIG